MLGQSRLRSRNVYGHSRQQLCQQTKREFVLCDGNGSARYHMTYNVVHLPTESTSSCSFLSCFNHTHACSHYKTTVINNDHECKP